MRFEFRIQAYRPFFVSLYYKPYLAGVIYQLIHLASPDHASWLHDKGFFTLGDKHFKHFTFALYKFQSRHNGIEKIRESTRSTLPAE